MVYGRAAASEEKRIDFSVGIAQFGGILNKGTARRDRAPFGLCQNGCRCHVSNSQRGRVCARPEPACPGVGRGAWDGRMVVSSTRTVVSGQWIRREGAGGDRKAPKQSQIARLLVVDILLLRTNQGGIEPENKANSRPAVGGSYAIAWRPQGGQEEQEESENRLSIPFPLHSTPSHILNLLYLLVAGLIAACSPCSRFRLLLRSGQWSVKPKGARWRCEKSAKTKPIAQVLVLGTLKLTTNEGGIGQENKPNSRPAASREGRQNNGQWGMSGVWREKGGLWPVKPK